MSNALVATQNAPANTGFAMLSQEQRPRKISINPQTERITTVIGEKSIMRGDFVYEEGLKIDGFVQGTIEFGTDDGMCIVSKTATVEGNIQGPRALILGTIEGDLMITGTLVVAPSATITGNVQYGHLVVYEGANMSGSLSRMNTRQVEHKGSGNNEYPADVVPLQRQSHG